MFAYINLILLAKLYHVIVFLRPPRSTIYEEPTTFECTFELHSMPPSSQNQFHPYDLKKIRI